MSDNILPCPWCGSVARFRHIESSGDTCIDCDYKFCYVNPTTHYRKDSPADMIDAWNRRSLLPDASLAADLERAAQCLEDLRQGECWLDHHGGCQEHGYLSLEPGEKCPHQEATDLAARLLAHAKRIGGNTK